MKRMFVLLALCLSLSACVAGTISKSEDGTCEASLVALGKGTEQVDICGATATKSSTNTELIQALLQTLVK